MGYSALKPWYTLVRKGDGNSSFRGVEVIHWPEISFVLS